MRENMMSSLKILKKGEELPTLRLITHEKEIRIKKSSSKIQLCSILILHIKHNESWKNNDQSEEYQMYFLIYYL